jgi:hypothetical protein
MTTTATRPILPEKLHPLEGETLISLPRAARHFPPSRGAERCNPATAFRWATVGVLVHGRRVKLEAVRLGAGYHTSLEAIRRFVAALNAPRPDAAPVPVATAGQTARAAQRARKRAEAAGKKLAKLGMK